jgi:hypothetical protein
VGRRGEEEPLFTSKLRHFGTSANVCAVNMDRKGLIN